MAPTPLRVSMFRQDVGPAPPSELLQPPHLVVQFSQNDPGGTICDWVDGVGGNGRGDEEDGWEAHFEFLICVETGDLDRNQKVVDLNDEFI